MANGPIIRYGTPEHDKLISAIRYRIELWRSAVSNRLKAWKESEELYAAYQKPLEGEKKVEEGRPHYATIVIPYSYATLLTAHTYWSSVFLSRSPIFQFMGRHGESEQQVQAIEALIDYQVQVGGAVPVLFNWLMDAGKYGYGVIGVYWAEELQTITRFVEQPKEVMGLPVPGTSKRVEVQELIQGFIGNKLFNVRPHDFIFDPRVSLSSYQDGEFCGRLVSLGWNEILKRAAQGEFYNVDEVEKAASGLMFDRMQSSTVEELPSDTMAWSRPDRPSYVEVAEVVWEIVPAEWGLGDSGYPEKWVFTVAHNNVIMGCRPLGAYHGKFPFFVQSYDFEPYTVGQRGMLERLKPLSDVLNWLFNSHMYNVRKALNDQWIIDPSRVMMRDLKESGPGRLIRLTPEAYGTDVRTAVMQFPVVDITRQHLASLAQVIELMQRVTGVTDNLMGIVYPGGRKTATEVRTSSSFGVNRLRTVAEYFSAVGWAPLAQVLVQNSQQYYTATQKMRVVGDLAEGAGNFIEVSPESIQGFFDFIPVDGTLPVDRFAQANLWKEILIGLGQSPILAQQYDMGRIFAWMAQLAGLKNINQFKIDVAPDSSVLGGGGGLRPINTPEMQGVYA